MAVTTLSAVIGALQSVLSAHGYLVRVRNASDTPAHVELAEALGYKRAWLYDSPAVYPDVWMVLSRCPRSHRARVPAGRVRHQPGAPRLRLRRWPSGLDEALASCWQQRSFSSALSVRRITLQHNAITNRQTSTGNPGPFGAGKRAARRIVSATNHSLAAGLH